MTKCDEARRLLERVKEAEWKEGKNFHFDPPKLKKVLDDIDAFLAQLEPAAREAVEDRLWPEVTWRMRKEDATFVEGRMVTMPCCGFSFGDDYTDGHAEAYTCPLCGPDTPAAAAALLAQVEALKKFSDPVGEGYERIEPTHLRIWAHDIQEREGYESILVAFLLRMADRFEEARAALAPGEEKE